MSFCRTFAEELDRLGMTRVRNRTENLQKFAAAAAAAATAQKHGHTALSDGETSCGAEGPTNPRIPPKNSQTSRLEP